jgi:uncharacterized membrane protein
MRRNVILSGLLVFIIGVALVAVSFSQISSDNSLDTKFAKVSGSEWESSYINVTGSKILTVLGTSSNFSLIKSSEVPYVSELNVTDYAIRPTSGLTIGGEHENEYYNLNGSYVILAFENSTPSISYEILSGGSTFAIFGSLTVIGGILIFAGIVIMVVGAVLKRKN